MRRGFARSGVAVLALAMPLALATAAFAQDTAPVLPPQQPDPKAVPEKIEPQAKSDEPATTGTLSDQLDRSEGVIKPPPGVDPEMRVPAPRKGAGEVIIPPGTSDTDKVQPK